MLFLTDCFTSAGILRSPIVTFPINTTLADDEVVVKYSFMTHSVNQGTISNSNQFLIQHEPNLQRYHDFSYVLVYTIV